MARAYRRWFLACTLLSTFLLRSQAFYLPGAAPHDYHEGEQVNLFVNALTPMLAGSEHAKIVRLPLPFHVVPHTDFLVVIEIHDQL